MERRSLILGVQLPASYWREQLEKLSADVKATPTDDKWLTARAGQLGRGLGMLEGVVAELERAEERIEHQAAEEARWLARGQETGRVSRLAAAALQRGHCYALADITNASDGSWASIWRIESVGPRWITFREWTGSRWSARTRLLRSGWEPGEPFVPVEDPS